MPTFFLRTSPVDKQSLKSVLARRLSSLQSSSAAEEPRRQERQRRQAEVGAQLQQSSEVQKGIFVEQIAKVRYTWHGSSSSG
jgi:hypothetical protein